MQYTVKQTPAIRIGMSHVYIQERIEIAEDGAEYPRIVISLESDGGRSEIDTQCLPSAGQAAQLIQLFSRYL